MKKSGIYSTKDWEKKAQNIVKFISILFFSFYLKICYLVIIKLRCPFVEKIMNNIIIINMEVIENFRLKATGEAQYLNIAQFLLEKNGKLLKKLLAQKYNN